MLLLENKEVYLERIKSKQYLEQSEMLGTLIQTIERGLEKMEGSTLPPCERYPQAYKLLGLEKQPKELPQLKELSFYDPLLKNDPSQYQATLAALHPKEIPLMAILGPGGTGKTRLILEVLKHATKKGNIVLITAPTHAAVDVIAAKIIETNQFLGNEVLPFVRLGTQKEKIGANLPEGPIKQALLENWGNRSEILEKRLKQPTPFVVLGTATGFNESIFLYQQLQQNHPISFDQIIVDEAGKMSKGESLVLLKHLKAEGQLILLGDTKQLPPHALDHNEGQKIETQTELTNYNGKEISKEIFKLENRLEHQVSLLELIQQDKKIPIYHLKKSRRFVSILAGLAKYVTYGETLVPRDQNSLREKTQQEALKVIAYSSTKNQLDKQEKETKSWYNTHELYLAIQEFYSTFNLKNADGSYRYTMEDIVFISPYKEQLKRYDATLKLSAYYLNLQAKEMGSLTPQQQQEITQLLKTVTGAYLKTPLSRNPAEAVNTIRRQIINADQSKPLIPLFTFTEETAKMQKNRFPLLNQFSVPTSFDVMGECEENRSNTENGSSTIHKIQGGQRKVVLFSAVRANGEKNVGFFATKEGPAFITVAITRAEEKLVVIYDKETLHHAAKNVLNTSLRDFALRVEQMFQRIEEYYNHWKKNNFGESWRELFTDLNSFEVSL